MNTVEALRRLKRLGAIIVDVPGTGEIRVIHPRMIKSVLHQHPTRRKDASRTLLKLLKRVESGKFDRTDSAA